MRSPMRHLFALELPSETAHVFLARVLFQAGPSRSRLAWIWNDNFQTLSDDRIEKAIGLRKYGGVASATCYQPCRGSTIPDCGMRKFKKHRRMVAHF